MPLDGFVISAITHELTNCLVNARIDKIYQPEVDEIHMLLRNAGVNYRLLISISSSNPRVHLISEQKQNPESPPMFCMLMRKHLQGGKITNIEQYQFERIIYIDVESYDELGCLTVKRMVVEIMGKHSSLILMDKSNNKIIDSMKRVSSDINRYREILPGKAYIHPPGQDKNNPNALTKNSFLHLFEAKEVNLPLYKAIYTNLQGVSPTLAKEICYRANVDNEINSRLLSNEELEDVWNAINSLMTTLDSGQYTPSLYLSKDDQHVVDFSSISLHSLKRVHEEAHYHSISQVLEEYYLKRDLHERLSQKSADLKKIITQNIDRLQNKTQKLKEELTEAANCDIYRIYGELLTANMYSIQKGDERIEVQNFYEDNKRTIIELDPMLSPSQNAQKYFKKYSKMKKAIKEIKKQLMETNEDHAYFESISNHLDNAANIQDINDLRMELVEGGYIKRRRLPSKSKALSRPTCFLSSEGHKILVGKNNKQNDELTLKIASKNDLWFHTKDIPGSHVIVLMDHGEISDKTIAEAAELAAFHSKGKMSSNVPVDYTEIKYVKKPSGAKPGMVIYTNQKTIFVTPRQGLTEILNKCPNQ
ncbi:MAG: Rqc2 family fibronectin-binding protein [Bacillota bacterium]